MLMRFDPFREVDRVAQMLAQAQSSSAPSTVVMPMDAYREGDTFKVHFDLPGVDADSIDLTAEKNVLTVRAERRWEPSPNQEIIVSERQQGMFTRQLFLGESLDPARVEASYADGVLTLTIPVAEQAKPRRVQVTSGGGGKKRIGGGGGGGQGSPG
ncbi:MAG: Hsp20/alpha crystallin family protein [Actinomycetota bacterium]|nr:Hsp20/alpha crystallin family protein [Actinomycetota bacterium]